MQIGSKGNYVCQDFEEEMRMDGARAEVKVNGKRGGEMVNLEDGEIIDSGEATSVVGESHILAGYPLA